jgi:anti-anti-sigma factor
MQIAVEELAGGIAKVVLRGRFDTTGAVVVELPFQKIAMEKSNIVVDLSAVEFISSAGVRVLLFGAKIVDRKGGRMAIVCPNTGLARVLKIARVDELIPIFDCDADAAAAFACSSGDARAT